MNENYLGALDDNRPQSEKDKDYAIAETVGLPGLNPVEWVAKSRPVGLQYVLNLLTWRKFPVRNQDGSTSCVAQSMAKLLGILAYLRWGVFIVFSAGHIFMRRANKNIGNGQGMGADDVYKIAQQGVTFEELMPSMNIDDTKMGALFESDLHKQVRLSIGGWVWLPTGNIDAVASVIQTTKKGVMTWFKFHGDEWTNVPVVLRENPPNHHSVASVDLTLYDGEKSLPIDESWGDTYGFEGQRVIKESFYKVRNTHASYPIDFKFDSDSVPIPEKKLFSKVLTFIQIDPNTQEVLPEFLATHKDQEADVVRLQNVLKKEGLFPSNIASSGLYHNLTRKAVKAFQIKYAVASIEELNEVDGKRVGDKTLSKLNEIYNK